MATGIYRRGNKWWIRFQGINGKQKREPAGTDHKQAVLQLAERKKSVGDGKEPERVIIKNHTFEELCVLYREWMTGRQASAHIKNYGIGQLITEGWGTIPLKRFNTAMIETLQTSLISKGYKPSSNNKITGMVKHMIKKAVEWDMVEETVLKRVGKVKPLKEDPGRLRYLNPDECQILIEACEPHLKPIVITALHTGLRRGEILGLRWDNNIDLRNGFILLEKTKNGTRREIPISATLKGVLQSIPRRLDVPYVFFNSENGKRFKEIKRSFTTAMKKVETKKCPDCDYQAVRLRTKENAGSCPQCGVKLTVIKGLQDYHFHDNRHTFASRLVMEGVDILKVSKLLGHKSLSMTLKYAHLAPSHLVDAIGVLDKALSKTVSTKLAQKEGAIG